jgi:hypothetical protein
MKRAIALAIAILFALAACTSSPQASPSPLGAAPDFDLDLMAHYPLDGTADDVAGSGLHGQAQNNEATSDRLGMDGGALRFNGVDSLVTIPDNDLLDLTGDFSISFFIKGNSASDHEWLIINKHQAGVCQPAATSWMLRYSQDFGLRLVNYDTSVDCGKTILSAPNVDLLDDEWHLVVIVHDTETNAIALYVDGLLVEEADASRLSIQDNDVPLVIGNQTNGVPQHTLDAAIDDLRIYHRAIEEDVIQALYAEAQ